jgi:hypothetical protein
VGQQVAQLTLSDFGFGQQSDRIGQAAKIIQKRPIELLGIYDIINAIMSDEILHFFIHGFVDKFFPSFELLLGLLGVLFHCFSPDYFFKLTICCGRPSLWNAVLSGEEKR